MKTHLSLILFVSAFAFPALAQDAAHSDAVDQLVGSWQMQFCAEDGSCETVERTYEPVGDDGLVHYTELFGGEQNEGFVAYDEESGGFRELDYSADLSRDDVVNLYDNDPTTAGYFTDDEDESSRMMEWRVSQDGESVSLNALGQTFMEEDTGVLSTVFTRIQQITE